MGASKASVAPHGLDEDAAWGAALKRYQDVDGCRECLYTFSLALNDDGDAV
eukprot:CAMPEP_0174868808 /NCGR_PEP_ID=MMETSP1114-20130205/66694_1 /TAXON_ID=312471 /ORGANISM="Neobodo designis, Strain CCAP 1951/1" /LENGTH=50 /DNA_ID=CAMNT_0016104035 /DNA_START=10 /DNA_END=158 /DNA_ORIENTATION=+